MNVMKKANEEMIEWEIVGIGVIVGGFRSAASDPPTITTQVSKDAHSKMKGGAGRTLRRPTPLEKIIAQSDFIGFLTPSPSPSAGLQNI